MSKLKFFLKKTFETFVPLFKCYTCEDLQKRDILWITNNLKKREINNLKYLNKNAKIEFDSHDYHYILEFLKKVELENEIIIGIDDKEKFNKCFFNENLDMINSKKVKVMLPDNNIYNLHEYIKYEKTLYDMIKPALNLSPLEKFIYAFNIVTHYKEYKECDNDPNLSRDLYKILDNEYCVCVGFTTLLSDLLNKVNINNVTFCVDVDPSYESVSLNQVDFNEVILTEKIKHSRLYVYIKDEKYKVNGIYITDPTYDNNLFKDYYNHLLFTEGKNDKSRDYEWLDARLIFNASTLDEFNEKFDYLNKHQKGEINLLNFILRKLMFLDPNYFKKLQEKYSYIDTKYGVILHKSDFSDLKNELGNYIVFMFNNEINKNVIRDAILFVYKEFSLYKQSNEALKEVFKYNIERERRLFPKRYNIDKNGNKSQVNGYKKVLKK